LLSACWWSWSGFRRGTVSSGEEQTQTREKGDLYMLTCVHGFKWLCWNHPVRNDCIVHLLKIHGLGASCSPIKLMCLLFKMFEIEQINCPCPSSTFLCKRLHCNPETRCPWKQTNRGGNENSACWFLWRPRPLWTGKALADLNGEQQTTVRWDEELRYILACW
jgi:hypothetical protein